MTPNQGRPGPGKAGEVPRETTRLESDDEIRLALQAGRARRAAQLKQPPSDSEATTVEQHDLEVQAERPVERPPIAMLCILDDDKSDGEWLRLRGDRTVIGRTEADVRITHDGLISGQHAEIIRQRSSNGFRWVLVDLQSTNGTYVRIGSTPLRHENEVLVGSGRYRFEAGAIPEPSAASESGPSAQATRAWASEPMRVLVPSLVEITPAGPVQRFMLTLPEYWIGRDPQQCTIPRPADILVSPRHARLHRDAKGHWHIENNKSLNGLWFRVGEPIPLGNACRFRMGEQQFIFRAK
jgi:pSer/pThr/pTyr-binding forkhead associated (FHA) protein